MNVRLRFRTKRLMTVLTLLALPFAVARPSPNNPTANDIDASIKPGDG
jgi:hypothetical protein